MKKKLKIHPYLFLVLISLLWSCSEDDNSGGTTQSTIVEVAQANPNLSTLVTALEITDLVSTLNGDGPFTVLAPTNAAFDLFLATANFPSIEDVPVPVLRELLLNHVIGAGLDSESLRILGRNYSSTLAQGPGGDNNLSLYFDATNASIVFNGSSTVLEEDIDASNGIIHTVGTVIDLPTVVTFVTTDINFEQLTTALTSGTPGTDFVAILSGDGPFTMFAPADTAFDDLLDSNPDWNTVEDIEEGLLTAVLYHHVVSGNNRSESITNGSSLVTLEGDSITFSQTAGETTITDGSGNSDIILAVTDLQAVNGVIHLITKVMIPDTTN
ncbi:fasciclin domain-containing protein [Eudoraea chungangensis]|uniref:fasciclin domain-containing protein n=1 Tax=Eudoraea chungangensis TaxID=1481905 RepID=UPI0023EC059C|nr:fasciclin domain-containing protein [Eudoraea chungangensis]